MDSIESKINKISKKFGYNEELSSFLKTLYPHLVEYYGNENLIYNALLNAEIILCEDLYEFAKSDPDLFESLCIQDEIELCGGYASNPHVTYDKREKKYIVDGMKRIIIIKGNSLYYDETKSCLIHEICHLIKSYADEYEIMSDVVVQKSGFIRYTNSLKSENNQILVEDVFATGVGLEEGFNILAEKEIGSKLGINLEIESEYVLVHRIAQMIMSLNIPDIKKIVLDAQIYHDNKKIDEVIGIGFYELQDLADKILVRTVEIISNLTNENIVGNEFDEIYNLLKDNYQNIIEHIRSHRRQRSN